ncbi:MAG: hypothetical protein ABEJ30_03585 [Halorientalis sp.]
MGTVYGYPRRAVAWDLAGVAAVPVALVAVHVGLSPETRAAWAFSHETVRPLALYTSTLVHVDAGHLLGNVSGYLAATVVAYGLSLQAGRRRWFRRTALAVLAVLPVAVGLTSYALLAAQFPSLDPVTRGFSGVAAGFVGVLFVALSAALAATHGRRTALVVSLAVWLLILAEVSVAYGDRWRWAAVALAVGGWVLCVRDLVDGPGIPDPGALLRGRNAQFTLAVVLLAVLVAQLFPPDVVGDDGVTNVFAHGAGLVSGVALGPRPFDSTLPQGLWVATTNTMVEPSFGGFPTGTTVVTARELASTDRRRCSRQWLASHLAPRRERGFFDRRPASDA